jgi:hypothetical protein
LLRSCALGAALCALLAAGTARAAGGNEDENEVAASGNADAKKRFAEGNERYARGEYEAAIESFRAAIAAEPKLPGPYRNLGLAYRALNRCVDALPMYEKYLALKPESRFTERVRKEIELCRAKLGLATPGQKAQPPVAVTQPPAPVQNHEHAAEAQSILHVAANLIGGEATDEATVRVDGLVRGATPLTIPVTSGPHKVDLARVGFESASATLEIGPGERRDVELTMNKLALAPIVPIVSPTGSSQSSVPVATGPAEPSGPKKSYAKYGWILIGVAAATGAIGAGFGIAESRLHRDAIAADPTMTSRSYVDDKRHTGQIYGDVAEAGLAVGGAALLTGAIIFIADPSRGETHETQKYMAEPKWNVAPSASRNGGSLVATVRF